MTQPYFPLPPELLLEISQHLIRPRLISSKNNIYGVSRAQISAFNAFMQTCHQTHAVLGEDLIRAAIRPTYNQKIDWERHAEDSISYQKYVHESFNFYIRRAIVSGSRIFGRMIDCYLAKYHPGPMGVDLLMQWNKSCPCILFRSAIQNNQLGILSMLLDRCGTVPLSFIQPLRCHTGPSLRMMASRGADLNEIYNHIPLILIATTDIILHVLTGLLDLGLLKEDIDCSLAVAVSLRLSSFWFLRTPNGFRNLEIIKRLVAAGADAAAKGALHCAALRGNLNILEILIQPDTDLLARHRWPTVDKYGRQRYDECSEGTIPYYADEVVWTALEYFSYYCGNYLATVVPMDYRGVFIEGETEWEEDGTIDMDYWPPNGRKIWNLLSTSGSLRPERWYPALHPWDGPEQNVVG